eukprot:gene13298-17817_t
MKYNNFLVTSIMFPVLFLCLNGNKQIVDDKTKINEISSQISLIEDRLKLIYNKQSICWQTWGRNYSSIHTKNLISTNNHSKNNLLVAIPNISGMADRIVGFVTVFLMSILTNKAFQIGRREELPIFEIAFYSPNVNWTRPQDPKWIIEPLKFDAKSPRNYDQLILEKHEHYAINMMEDMKMVNMFTVRNLNDLLSINSSIIFITTTRGRTIKMIDNTFHHSQLQQMGLNKYNIFRCLFNYLMQPKPHIFLPVYNQFIEMTNNIYQKYSMKSSSLVTNPTNPTDKVVIIGIQIRVGDGYWNNRQGGYHWNDFDVYFKCAKQIEDNIIQDNNNNNNNNENKLNIKWYLITESEVIRKEVIQQFGNNKIITALTGTIEHSANEFSSNSKVSNAGFETAAAEWWLFGMADYFVITKPSGYGRTAAMRSFNNNDRIYQIPHYKYGKEKINFNCDKKSFTHIDTIGTSWAGIR